MKRAAFQNEVPRRPSDVEFVSCCRIPILVMAPVAVIGFSFDSFSVFQRTIGTMATTIVYVFANFKEKERHMLFTNMVVPFSWSRHRNLFLGLVLSIDQPRQQR